METYRRERSWAWNLTHGPRWDGPVPRVPDTPRKEILGLSLRSRVGIAAGLLLGSRWVELYARLGFDFLTYKTVRSAARPCHPLPNWVFVAPDAPDGGGGVGAERDPVFRPCRRPRDPRRATSAVCFGMPSVPAEVWRRDVQDAVGSLGPGQALVVSVVGTPRDGGGTESLAEDFARCARDAAAAGAQAVEANFSCPNVLSAEGSIYQDPALAGRLATALRDALPSTPLLIKCGAFRDPGGLESFLSAVAPSADAVVLVNGIQRRVLRADGRPVFGRIERVGILGRAIHGPAVEAVRRAVAHVAGRGLELEVIGVGGAMDEHDPGDFLAAGASGVVLGSVPMLDPGLAARLKAAHPDW